MDKQHYELTLTPLNNNFDTIKIEFEIDDPNFKIDNIPAKFSATVYVDDEKRYSANFNLQRVKPCTK